MSEDQTPEPVLEDAPTDPTLVGPRQVCGQPHPTEPTATIPLFGDVEHRCFFEPDHTGVDHRYGLFRDMGDGLLHLIGEVEAVTCASGA